ncbi:glycoside hydrolase family 57 protein [Saccharicrinis sp. FJH2]|uniref:glycoside hydrolase family 57 protein n=1 Tax=Saccharicrinis sp. FJH65 TaxID=3344659 RepID=UPI0035F25687
MKTICFYFQVHQPFRLKRYRFFDIGNDHYYYDDYTNESITTKVAYNSYLPANKLILSLIKKHKGAFKVAYSISGLALEHFELYAPEVLESFKELAATGQVEFLAETYAHSLAALKTKSGFKQQIEKHSEKIEELFGQKPTVFRNTELIYSDEMGLTISELGFKAMLTEGAKHVLGWKSPNFMYCNSLNPKLKVLLRNYKLSDDIAFRFSNSAWSEHPLTADKYIGWINSHDQKEEIFNIFMDYETFGEHQKADTGIFDFIKSLPEVAIKNKFKFATPSEVAKSFNPISAIHVPYPISWADEERDLTAWLGNELQDEAFNKLYKLKHLVDKVDDFVLKKNWQYLQCSDHFYYMCTKFFSDGEVHAYFNPYDSPYDAFMNYMNVLSDFELQLKEATKGMDEKTLKIASLEKELEETKKQLKSIQTKIEVRNEVKPVAATKTTTSKSAATKTSAKKTTKTKTTVKGTAKPKTTSKAAPKTKGKK